MTSQSRHISVDRALLGTIIWVEQGRFGVIVSASAGRSARTASKTGISMPDEFLLRAEPAPRFQSSSARPIRRAHSFAALRLHFGHERQRPASG